MSAISSFFYGPCALAMTAKPREVEAPAPQPAVANWLTVALAATVVASGGQPQGPPLPPTLMQVHGGNQMAASAAAALSPANGLRRIKRVISDLHLFTGFCESHKV